MLVVSFFIFWYNVGEGFLIFIIFCFVYYCNMFYYVKVCLNLKFKFKIVEEFKINVYKIIVNLYYGI